jgi:cytochrome c oxidase subunit I+III
MDVRTNPSAPPPPFVEAYRPPRGVAGWVISVAHKRIGRRFIATALVFLLIGAVEALLLRTQLAGPAGGVLDREAFDRVFTLHGTTMVFLFALPMLLGFSIYLVPLVIGARDLPLPRLAQFGYWCYLAGGAFLYLSTIGGVTPDSGFSAPPPLSGPVYGPAHQVDVWLSGTALVEIGALAAAIALFAAVLTTRAPGMSLWRMPLIAWSSLATSVLVLVGVGPLLVADVMLGSDRTFGTSFFATLGGGSPLLWQRLWWIGGIPQVALLLAVPGVGIASQVVEASSGRSLVGRPLAIAAIVGLALADLAVWIAGNRAGDALAGPQLVATIFALLALVPFLLLFVSWAATWWTAGAPSTASTAFVLAGAVIGTLGVAACALVLVPPFALQVRGSQFAVGAMHLLLFGAVVFPVFAALHFWYPKLTGRLFPDVVGTVSAALLAVGVTVTFVPLLVAGLLGMPRRIATYPTGTGWTGLNLLSTIGAYVLVAAVLLALGNLALAARRGAAAEANPWRATTLEWTTASPPAPYNFDRPPLLVPDDQLHDGWRRAGVLADRLDRAPGDLRATLSSSPLAGEPTGVAVVGGASAIPIVVVLGLVVLLGGMSTMSIWVTLVGAVIALLGVLLWLLAAPRGRVHASSAFADLDPELVGVPGPSVAAAAAATLACAAFLLALVLGEALLWSQAPTWPPLVNPEYPPPGTWAVAAVVCAVSAAVLLWLPGSGALGRRNDPSARSRWQPRAALVAATVLALTTIVCWVVEGFVVGFQPSNDAYTASFFLFVAVAVATSAVAAIVALNAALRFGRAGRAVSVPAALAVTLAAAATIVAWAMVVLIPQLTSG